MDVESLASFESDYSQSTKYDATVQKNNDSSNVTPKDLKPVANSKPEKEAEKQKGKEIRITEDDIAKTINNANKKIEPLYLEFHYKIHQKTNQLMISVVNSQTKEVVRDIPPERALDALAKMWEMCGVLLDKKG